MDNYDQMTRRNFLTRVTTLAGGLVVATTPGLLAGCGGSSGGGGNPLQLPALQQPAATTAKAYVAANTGKFLPISSSVTDPILVATLSASQASDVSAVVALMVGAVPDLRDTPMPEFNEAGKNVTTFTTGADLGLSNADIAGFYTNYLTQLTATTPLVAGDKVIKETFTIAGHVITVPAVVDANNNVIFDPILSLLPPDPNNSSNVQKAVRVSGTSGVGQEGDFNGADGHMIAITKVAATANFDANGNLNSSKPGTGTITSVQLGPNTVRESIDPTTNLAVQDVTITTSTRASAKSRDIIVTCVTFTFNIVISFYIIVGGRRILLWTFHIRIIITICFTSSGGGTQ